MKSLLIALFMMMLPFLVFLNIRAKMQDKGAVSIESVVVYIENFPVPDNSLHVLEETVTDLEKIVALFNGEFDGPVLEWVLRFVTYLFKITTVAIRLVVSALVDIYNIARYVLYY